MCPEVRVPKGGNLNQGSARTGQKILGYWDDPLMMVVLPGRDDSGLDELLRAMKAPQAIRIGRPGSPEESGVNSIIP